MIKFFRKIFGQKEEVRVRIAPSPTGFLHIGTARTALFNYLFARHHGGKFILRIEDTDLERSEKRFETDIIESLKWLGLNWDEGPYYQSKRLDIYEKYLNQLLKNKQAYYCACSKEELEKERQEQLKKGEAPKYSGRCRNQNIPADKAQLIRFKVPEEIATFTDLIRGEISFDARLIGDIAVAKNLRTPLYNFAVVVDDEEMRISHVIRGEDHIANTPKQILIQRALGFKTPKYAHLPLILDPDRSKMSKRYSATSVQEYRDQGYLAEAVVNFMALLGWHPSEAEKAEKMSPSEIIKRFTIDRVQKGGAVFNIQKLDWLNSQYLKEKNNEELYGLLQNFYGKELSGSKEAQLKILEFGKSRMSKLSDFKELQTMFNWSDYSQDLLIWKNTPKEKILENLKTIREMAEAISAQEFKQVLMGLADTRGRGEVLWPLRVALSGKDKSPGPFEIMEVMGKEESLRRIEIAISKLKS